MRIYRLSKVYGHTFSCTFSEVKNCFNPVYEEGEKNLASFVLPMTTQNLVNANLTKVLQIQKSCLCATSRITNNTRDMIYT